jgi:hypothetical protein
MLAATSRPEKKLTLLRATITGVAGVAIAARLIWPELRIDALTLGLLILAALPWMVPLVKSAEFPGGWKVEFRDIAAAVKSAEQIRLDEPAAPAPKPGEERPPLSYLDILEQDPSLAMVALRIEIEEKLRTLAERHQIQERQPVGRLLDTFQQKNILDPTIAHGLIELVKVGNDAAHGARIDASVGQWAFHNADRLLHFLDRKIAQRGKLA